MVEQVHTEVGAFEDGEPFLLLGHFLKQSSVRLLCPKQLPPKRDYFLLSLRLGLLLHLQSLQGLLERHLGLRHVDLRRIESPLGGSCPFHHEQFRRPRSHRLGRMVSGLMDSSWRSSSVTHYNIMASRSIQPCSS